MQVRMKFLLFRSMVCFSWWKRIKRWENLSSSSGLQRCWQICLIRRSKNFKYKNVTLPEQIGGLEGYHVTCYRRFTTLSKEYTEVDTSQVSANYSTRSQSIILSTTSTGVLSKVCIFCEEKDKKHNRNQSLVNVETPI